MIAKDIKQCYWISQKCTKPERFEYHCLPDRYHKQFIEVCAPTKWIVGKKPLQKIDFQFFSIFKWRYNCIPLRISQVWTVHSMIWKNTSSNQTTITNAKASVHSITVRVPYMSVSITSYWQYYTIVDKRQLPLNWVLISLLFSNRGTFVNAEYAICFKNRLRHLGYLGFKNHEARAPVAKWLEKWTCAQATQQVHFFRFIINLQRCLWNHFTHFRCNFTKEHNTIALFLVEIYVYWNSNRGLNSIWKSV